MRLRRDILLLIGLFALLAIIILLVSRGDDSNRGGEPTSHSSSSGGALALYRWFEALGYPVSRLEYRGFALDAEDSLLIVLGPSRRYSREDAALVRSWVEAGGTLLLADERPGRFSQAGPLFEAFGAEIVDAPAGWLQQAPVLQPALDIPPASEVIVQTRSSVTLKEPAATLVGPEESPTIVGMQVGQGYIYLSAALYPFSNTGLADEQNAALVLNLLRRARPGGRIIFDEIHHGFVSPPSLRSLLLESPWGWAIVHVLLIGAAYVALSGQRFGQPVPLREEIARRSSAEYLDSVADLLRRGGKHSYIANHYVQLLKRRLARTLGISPSQEDQAFIAALAREQPQRAAAVERLLIRARRSPLSEAELIAIVIEADRI